MSTFEYKPPVVQEVEPEECILRLRREELALLHGLIGATIDSERNTTMDIYLSLNGLVREVRAIDPDFYPYAIRIEKDKDSPNIRIFRAIRQ